MPSDAALRAAREALPCEYEGTTPMPGIWEHVAERCVVCKHHNAVALAIDAAVAKERERCAREVEAFTKLSFGWKAALTAGIRSLGVRCDCLPGSDDSVPGRTTVHLPECASRRARAHEEGGDAD